MTWQVIWGNIKGAFEVLKHQGLSPTFITSSVFSPFLVLTSIITAILIISAVLRIWSMFHGNQ